MHNRRLLLIYSSKSFYKRSPLQDTMLLIDDVVGLKVKIFTTDGETIIGKVHSYSPHTLITLISTTSPQSQIPSSLNESISDDNNPTYTKDATFIAINVSFVKSIQALEKDKPRGKICINEKFAGKINAPNYIPTDTLGSNIRKGSKEMTKQEIEFKLRKMSKLKDISDNGKKILKSLATILPINTISVDNNGNIAFQDSAIKIIKPYKAVDVKVIGGDGSNAEEQHFNYIKSLVEKAWDKIEENQKGG